MDRLYCSRCGASFPLNDPRWCCDCGSPLDLEFTPVFDLDLIKSRPPSLWRYREAIPVESEKNIITFNEGFTPLLEVDVLDCTVYFKQDYLFPTGSFKDRGATVMISKVKELGISTVCEDSSGNAGAAVAAYCARAGIGCEIYVPAHTSAGKRIQISVFGARLNLVPGSREDTSKAVRRRAERVYYASHIWNPFFYQGTKTFAYEVCEQLDWRAPDTLVVPVGHGSLLLGAHIGFKDLIKAGLIKKMPRFIAVQSANCAPLVETFRKKLRYPVDIKAKKTIAEGISIAKPVMGGRILEVIRETGGEVIPVRETEIMDAMGSMGRCGIFIEPTSATVVAGIEKMLRQGVLTDGLTVSVFTGHGLKAPDKFLGSDLQKIQ